MLANRPVYWLQTLLFSQLVGCDVLQVLDLSDPLDRGPTHSCDADLDCEPSEICRDVEQELYGGESSLRRCLVATCETDDDCDDTCTAAVWPDGCGTRAIQRCALPEDTCTSNDDCDEGLYCAVDYDTEVLACIDSVTCAIGRPLTVQQQVRTAPTMLRSDWSLERAGAATATQALCDHWREVAALEHASVASFARFTLDLLALGAPADLVEHSQRAGLDEIRHARSIYGLLAALTGEPVGPGPLPIEGVAGSADPRVVFARLVAEGCVGETVGAALVRADAEAAVNAELADMLHGIAADEADHAVLAWRTARWMCRTWPELEPTLPGLISAALLPLMSMERPSGLADEGVIGTAAAHRILERVALQILEPLTTSAG